MLAIGLLFCVFPSPSTASASIHPTALDEDSNISLRNDAPDEIYRTDAVSAAASPFDSSILTRAPHLIRRVQSSRLPPQVVRPATDAVYYRAQVKGHTLMCWMQNPALAGDQAISPWNRFEQLAEWGWTGPQGSNPIRINYSEERDPAMRRLVGSRPRTGMVGQVEHKTTPAHAPVTLDGRTYQYPATMAEYQNIFYPKDGVILAYYNFGPDYFINGLLHHWNSQTMLKPELSRLSDIWWLLWTKICSLSETDPRDLRYIIQKSVINESTQTVLARVLQHWWPAEPEISQGRAPRWPGKLITRDMAGFDALLGTENIWGVPYLLVQRCAVLGRREVKGIRVYNPDPRTTYYEVNMIVEIGDVEVRVTDA